MATPMLDAAALANCRRALLWVQRHRELYGRPIDLTVARTLNAVDKAQAMSDIGRECVAVEQDWGDADDAAKILGVTARPTPPRRRARRPENRTRLDISERTTVVTYPKPNEYGITDAAREQRIAELDSQTFSDIVARTRPHMPTEPEQRLAEARAKSQVLIELAADQQAKLYAASGFSQAAVENDGAAQPPAPVDNRPPKLTTFQPENGIESRTAQLERCSTPPPKPKELDQCPRQQTSPPTTSTPRPTKPKCKPLHCRRRPAPFGKPEWQPRLQPGWK